MNRSIMRLLPLVTILLASLTAACNNGGTIVGPPPPPPTGNFSNASLKGQYAFSMSGTELCGPSPGFSTFFARAGSFTADGSGHISGALKTLTYARELAPCHSPAARIPSLPMAGARLT